MLGHVIAPLAVEVDHVVVPLPGALRELDVGEAGHRLPDQIQAGLAFGPRIACRPFTGGWRRCGRGFGGDATAGSALAAGAPLPASVAAAWLGAGSGAAAGTASGAGAACRGGAGRIWIIPSVAGTL
jgi:hypothetical protein